MIRTSSKPGSTSGVHRPSLDTAVPHLGRGDGSSMRRHRDRPRLVLYSELALYSIHWAAFRQPVRSATPTASPLPGQLPIFRLFISSSAGRTEPATASRCGRSQTPRRPNASLGCAASSKRFDPTAFGCSRNRPTSSRSSCLQPALLARATDRRGGMREHLRRLERPRAPAGRLVWPRIDALAAVATASVDGVRAVGMPTSIPAEALVAGALPPPTAIAPMSLPLPTGPGDFVVGFVGRITQQKGWRDLAAAVATLPRTFKLVLAGSVNDDTLRRTWTNPPSEAAPRTSDCSTARIFGASTPLSTVSSCRR